MGEGTESFSMGIRLSLSLLTFTLVLALTGCSARGVTAVGIADDERPINESGILLGRVIYRISEDIAFMTALEAYAALYPKQRVDDVVWGSRRGYRTEERSVLGDAFWRHEILVIPVVGTDSSGNEIRGYRYAYSGVGTLSARDERTTGLVRFIRARLESNAVAVIMLRDGEYETDGRAYLSLNRDAGDTLLLLRRAPASNADRLNYLDSMRQRGLISEEEYEARLRQILDRSAR